MKIILTDLSGIERTIPCTSFDFDSGFLKIIPEEKADDPNEIYVSFGSIKMIQNFGKKRSVKKTDEKT